MSASTTSVQGLVVSGSPRLRLGDTSYQRRLASEGSRFRPDRLMSAPLLGLPN